jgi:hypothetical protein|tara:strand:+ start:215 stop:340 length:126 start_codon:yes stop_codon:yes gene_type:complete
MYTLPETEDVSWRPCSLGKNMARSEKNKIFGILARKNGLEG